jgi:uncharacterized protein
MTTNGTLLRPHIDYLVKNNFNISISLDGNKNHQIYRVKKDGSNSFNLVYNNAKLIYQYYPNFFKSNVNFMSVLHDKNSFEEIIRFFKNEFDKSSVISELSSTGIEPCKLSEFKSTFKNALNDYSKIKIDTNSAKLFESLDPKLRESIFYTHQNVGNIFKTYSELLFSNINALKIPTGTCFPFERKIFISSSGKILPCERVSTTFELGSISNNKVNIDLDSIAGKYNGYYDKFRSICFQCSGESICQSCLFHNESINNKELICNSFLTSDMMNAKISNTLSFFETNPHSYQYVWSISFK